MGRIDFRTPSRQDWKFTYKGKELLNFAIARRKYFTKRAEELRTLLAEAVNDKSRRLTSEANQRLQKSYERAATLAEECVVFEHEFNRSQDRDFHLSASDVVFFGIAGDPVGIDDPDDGF